MLDARLSTQSLLPERQRTSYEIRRGLEEMERLLQGMDSYSRIANLGLLAPAATSSAAPKMPWPSWRRPANC